MVRCKICGKNFKFITNTHLKSAHNFDLKQYILKYSNFGVGPLAPNVLPKTDPRFKKWKESLKNRPAVWSKGKTKKNHPSLLKTSLTFKKKKIDNFAKWREKMKKAGKIRNKYPVFKKNGDLAELIGVALGDGHFEVFPRTERLTIFSNEKNDGFVKRYEFLMKKIFGSNPTVFRHGRGCTGISVYQKYISDRMGIPPGAKKIKNFLCRHGFPAIKNI
jgi:hypothetical protein